MLKLAKVNHRHKLVIHVGRHRLLKLGVDSLKDFTLLNQVGDDIFLCVNWLQIYPRPLNLHPVIEQLLERLQLFVKFRNPFVLEFREFVPLDCLEFYLELIKRLNHQFTAHYKFDVRLFVEDCFKLEISDFIVNLVDCLFD